MRSGPFLSLWWRVNVVNLLPGSAADSLTISHINDSPTYLDSMPLAAAVVVAWLVISIGGAYLTLRRRDA